MKEKFKSVMDSLKSAGIHCRGILYTDGGITVELGYNFPDELFFKAYDSLSEEMRSRVDFCEETSGGDVKEKMSVNGGPKRY